MRTATHIHAHAHAHAHAHSHAPLERGPAGWGLPTRADKLQTTCSSVFHRVLGGPCSHSCPSSYLIVTPLPGIAAGSLSMDISEPRLTGVRLRALASAAVSSSSRSSVMGSAQTDTPHLFSACPVASVRPPSPPAAAASRHVLLEGSDPHRAKCMLHAAETLKSQCPSTFPM